MSVRIGLVVCAVLAVLAVFLAVHAARPRGAESADSSIHKDPNSDHAPTPTAPTTSRPFSSTDSRLTHEESSAALKEVASSGIEDVPALEPKLLLPDGPVQLEAARKLLLTEAGRKTLARHYLEIGVLARDMVDGYAKQKTPEALAFVANLNDAVVTGFDAPNADARRNAALAAQRLKVQPGAERLNRFLLVESDESALCAGIALAGSLHAQDAHATLMKLARGPRPANARRAAFENLIRTGKRDDPEALAAACEALGDPEGAVRLGAVVALGFQGWERIPAAARERIKVLATSDTYHIPDQPNAFPVQDAAKTLLLAAGQNLTDASKKP